MRVRKLLVTTLLTTSAAVPAASAAPDLVPAAPSGREANLVETDFLERLGAVAPDGRRRARREAPPRVTVPPELEAIAECESGGNPRAIGGGGEYRGKYQFSYGTWAAVGGTGDPAQAAEAEQDRRAVILYSRSGAGQWPACGG
jgi:hypothetical protein